MNPLIEFCVNNLASGSQQAFEELKRDPDLDIIELGCTSHCAICAMTLFAIVEGKCVTGDTPDDLIKNIYNYLEENEWF
ncbi:YuzB family protein [Bacillaceae bacterium W0354]